MSFQICRCFPPWAATLVEHVDLDRAAQADWDACPIIFLYLHALELIMKAIILGEGAKFLSLASSDKPVPVTHSLPALLADVIRIVDKPVARTSLSRKHEALRIFACSLPNSTSWTLARSPSAIRSKRQGRLCSEHTTFSANAFVQDVEAVVRSCSILFALLCRSFATNKRNEPEFEVLSFVGGVTAAQDAILWQM